VKLLVSLLLVLFGSVAAHPQELSIAAAADLRPALEQIAASFKNSSGIDLRVSYGSSGNFYQQLKNGAPFDVFLSANTEYPKKLQSTGLVLAGSYYEFARGSIVLLVPAKSGLDLTQGLRALLNPAVKKIAIADPRHAPYGQAAVAALTAEGIYKDVSPRIVTGENISEALSFALSGAADAAIAAKSLALSPAGRAQTKFVAVPASEYPPIEQAMVVLQSSKNQSAAMKFESYMKGAQAKTILKQYGFEVPASVEAP
jgi:molybdate transport system substrate-binding protein